MNIYLFTLPMSLLIALVIFVIVFIPTIISCEKSNCDADDLACIRNAKREVFHSFIFHFIVLTVGTVLIYFVLEHQGSHYKLSLGDTLLVLIAATTALILRRLSFNLKA